MSIFPSHEPDDDAVTRVARCIEHELETGGNELTCALALGRDFCRDFISFEEFVKDYRNWPDQQAGGDNQKPEPVRPMKPFRFAYETDPKDRASLEFLANGTQGPGRSFAQVTLRAAAPEGFALDIEDRAGNDLVVTEGREVQITVYGASEVHGLTSALIALGQALRDHYTRAES
jgi:hypothetical protein